ncbi:MAG: hypothetical protein GWN76_20455 [candidate division Zixibacteria bacterium]|nr:hypothetical protein [Candidatus Saccharibacteria bacterium]NIR66636.1 hypothetical protein [candidate division Zixibacteria bacterium]NIU16309.1 hypothetical protein [candidate division Zixibacteria bacterium]NIW96827.1 hypothetical protein [Phycisphaerae bacterium]
MTGQNFTQSSDIEEISGVLPDSSSGGRRVTITVLENNGYYFAVYYLHEKGDNGEAPRPEGYVFHRTENIFSHDLYYMRLRVKEEADYRGLDHVRHLGF